MEEIWRDIEGYEGYQVSNLGNVKNLGSQWHPGEHLITQHEAIGGYIRFILYKNGRYKYHLSHRLVAKAFPEICGEWFEGCEVDHIDTVRDNNTATNLRVCTKEENNNNPLTIVHRANGNRRKSRRRKELIREQISKFYDTSLSIGDNLQLLNDNGVDIGKDALYAYCKEYCIQTNPNKLSDDELLTIIDVNISARQNLQILKDSGIKVGNKRINKLLNIKRNTLCQ